MSAARLHGRSVVEQPVDYSEKGYTRTWVGSFAAIEALRLNPPFIGATTMRTYSQGAKRILRAEFSGGSAGNITNNAENVQVRWELDSDVLEKPIKTLKNFASLGGEMLHKLEKIAESDDPSAVKEALVNYSKTSWAGKYLRRILIGATHFETYVFVIRKTTTAAYGSYVKASFTDVNQVVSLSSSSTPDQQINPLSKMPFTPPKGEYKKSAPKISDMGKGRFVVIEEWKSAEKWDGQIYKGGTGEGLEGDASLA